MNFEETLQHAASMRKARPRYKIFTSVNHLSLIQRLDKFLENDNIVVMYREFSTCSTGAVNRIQYSLLIGYKELEPEPPVNDTSAT